MSFTPAFVLDITNEEKTIIRVNSEPRRYISIDQVQYIEKRTDEDDDNSWESMSEEYLEAGTTNVFKWLGFNYQHNSGSFPEAEVYRIQGEAGEYSQEEILSLINSWDHSFSGYPYWNGSNWLFQHTEDELGHWQPEAFSLEEVASYTYWGRTHTLYLGTDSDTTDYYIGQSSSGGETIRYYDLEDLLTTWPNQHTGRKLDSLPAIYTNDLLLEAAEHHLACPDAQQRAERLKELSPRNLYAERWSLAEIAHALQQNGSDTTEAELREQYAQNGTLL